jgi:hypothetical protein
MVDNVKMVLEKWDGGMYLIYVARPDTRGGLLWTQ